MVQCHRLEAFNAKAKVVVVSHKTLVPFYDLLNRLDWHHVSAKYLRDFQEMIGFTFTLDAFVTSVTMSVASIATICAHDSFLTCNASGYLSGFMHHPFLA